MEKTATEFVKYLNTLHRCGGNNKNSTAESNHNQIFAHDILGPEDDLKEKIEYDLFHGDGKVLLTGFAGDGKTTLAQMLVEELTEGNSLNNPIEEFYIQKYNKTLVVIKDLSENRIQDNDEIVTRYLLNKQVSLLIVSNTGAVIYRMKEAYKLLKEPNKIAIENKILDGISTKNSDSYGTISLEDIKINVINLVKHDNIPTAKVILEKIVMHPAWDILDPSTDQYHPILLNIKALKQSYVRDRLFLMYQRLFEYDNRFTLRNFIEHFSYIITGNLKLEDKVNNPDEYLFYNNVFGSFESFDKKDIISNNITIIRNIRNQYFGTNISPTWKRAVWNKTDNTIYENIFEPFQPYFSYCRENGYSNGQNINRIKLYRLIYFLISPSCMNDVFLNSFLNSPGLSLWRKIQNNNNLTNTENIALFNNLRHTIKEYFAGLKLPANETGENKDKVYVTMSRRKNIRQSAQVVLGQFSWVNDTKVKIDVYKDFRGRNQFRLLRIKETSNKSFKSADFTNDDCISLLLPLPFLDFLLNANSGNLLDQNYQYFQKRLDFFKNEMIANQIDKELYERSNLLLVRLKPDRNLGDLNFELVDSNNNEKILEVH